MKTRKKARIGFIGLGNMGHGMASNILKHEFPLSVMAHRKREAVEELVRSGAHEVATPAEMAARSDIVILCVAGAAEVDEIVRGKSGLAAGARPGLIIIDCTTSDPAVLLALASDFAEQGISFADAPLGRSPREARNGTLSTMVGCNAEIFRRIRPVLAAFATSIQHVGRLGDGHRLKLVNNLISLGYAALYSDALAMALKAGLTIEAFDHLVRSSRMHCEFYETFIGWARDGNADSHRFALRMALRTISDVGAFSTSLGLKGVLVDSVRDIYRQAVEAGDGDANLPELVRSVAAANGITVTPVQAKGDRPGDRPAL